MKKKIGIITLHFADNFGAILQAFSLQTILQKLGYEPEFIKLKEFKEDINNCNFENFKKSKNYLNISKEIYNKEKTNYDTIIVGSDEMWNLNNSFEHLDEYFGYNLNCKNIITYAPSANGVSKETFKGFYNDKIDFSKFNYLSVRDVSTQKLVKEISNIDANLVLDPTLLMESFEPFIKYPNKDLKDYIILYGYKFSEIEKEKIVKFAKEKNKKLCYLSLGSTLDWCENINVDIFEFLGYIKQADYTIINTFHGLLFSLILEKEFAIFNVSSKINDVLKNFNIEQRDANKVSDLNIIFNDKVDYNNINKIKLKQREKSLKYLKESII